MKLFVSKSMFMRAGIMAVSPAKGIQKLNSAKDVKDANIFLQKVYAYSNGLFSHLKSFGKGLGLASCVAMMLTICVPSKVEAQFVSYHGNVGYIDKLTGAISGGTSANTTVLSAVYAYTHTEITYTSPMMEIPGVSGPIYITSIGFRHGSTVSANPNLPNMPVYVFLKRRGAATTNEAFFPNLITATNTPNLGWKTVIEQQGWECVTDNYLYPLTNVTAGTYSTIPLDEPFLYDRLVDGTLGVIVVSAKASPPSSTAGSCDHSQSATLSTAGGTPSISYTRYTMATSVGNCTPNYASSVTQSYNSTQLYHPFMKIEYVLDVGPSINEIFPNGGIFEVDPFTGTIVTPSVTFTRKPDMPPCQLQFFITDNAYNRVFTAVDPNNPSSDWINLPNNLASENPILYTFTNAVGSRVDNTTGSPRLSFRTTEARGGYYTVTARLRYIDENNEEKIVEKIGTFEVQYALDIAIIDVIDPPNEAAYPLSTTPIRMQTRLKNVGANSFRNFAVTTKLTHIESGQFWSYTDTTRSSTDFVKDQEYTVDLLWFHPVDPVTLVPKPTGIYRYEVSVELLGVTEIPLLDNYMERTIVIDFPYDGEVRDILHPNATGNYVDQIFFPKATIANNAAFFTSGVAIEATIIALPSGDTVDSWTELVEELPASQSIVYEFYRPFIPKKVGDYMMTIRISDDDDFRDYNNFKDLIFSVEYGLSGEYRVGNNSPDFNTIEEALNAVYTQGVKDTVTFVLTDRTYNLGSLTSEYALDISSAVAGFSLIKDYHTSEDSANFNHNKLIRFVPSTDLSFERNAINISLLSKSGIGMRFSSSTSSSFSNAPVNILRRSTSQIVGERQVDYYPYNAKIEIDGGKNQSIRIGLSPSVPTNAPNRIPIMLDIGANNITIKNCLINGVSLEDPQIPSLLYDAKFNTFTFDDVNRVSAAILLRNSLPVDQNGVNSRRLDTVLISNVNIEGNNIEGGSFGIMSLGIGPLYDVNKGYYVGYYNTNNRIVKNRMNTFDIAGIFLGYEQGTQVLNNTIYVVGVASNEDSDVAGIMMGGFGKLRSDPDDFLGTTGYNNLQVRLDGNEISRIYSNRDAYGIKIEQEFNNFIYSQIAGNKFFANHNDSIDIFNNVIWDIQTAQTNYSGSRYGIRLFGSRAFNQPNKFAEFTVRRDTNYTISHTRIINNSIVLREDDNRKTNNDVAYIGGLVLQDIDTITMYNNAIAILDETNVADVVAAVVIQGKRPNGPNTKFEADNNVYYTPDMSVIRFIEQSQRRNSEISNPGQRNQFVGLEQWAYITNAERSTSMANFYPDLYITNTTPQSLRVTSPAPIGSYLSKRGRKIDFLLTDIHGNPRGLADQEYDIGAWAFAGRAFENDCGVLNFITPVAARDYTHPVFQEAEYIMTTNPINVIVNIRNNGSSPVNNRSVRLEVYQISDAGVENLIHTTTANLSVAPSETKALDFRLNFAEGLPFPRTYNELGITPPDRFRNMSNNVTPRYRYKVILPPDQDTRNDTNAPQKIVRYYLQKSDIRTIVSADNTTLVPEANSNNYDNALRWIEVNYSISPTNPASDISRIGGYLNFKALEKGLNELGYYYQTENGYDLIDRSAWEPSSINYSMYRYMFWSDAVNDIFTPVQESDISRFLNSASVSNRKNIIFSSEEISRNSYSYYASIDENDFAKDIFGTTPRGNGIFNVTYEPNTNDNDVLVTGNTLLPNINVTIRNTPLTSINPMKDVRMQPAIFENYGNNKLSSAQAMYYNKLVAMNKADKTFGLISFSPALNSIYLGVDWRNYEDPSIIISAILNHIGGLTIDPPTLSIELITFDANVINNKVLLNWETASEINVNNFVVERLNSSDKFVAIYETEATRSNTLSNSYLAVDSEVQAGNTYTYRLKSVNTDGSYSYSNEKVVSIDAASNFISLDKPTPNPVTDNMEVSFSLSSESNVKLYIIDLTGKEVMVLVSNQTFIGNNKLYFSLSNLAAGNYNLVLDVEGNIVSQSFNIVK